MAEIKRYLQEKKELVDSALKGYFPTKTESTATIQKAIRHSLFAGGKRIRPILAIAAFEAAGGKGNKILPYGCALEMIHTYSLIHDDLPGIDNDDFRRGKPTCHKVFGEAIAILAGDALLTEAFKLMTDRPDRYRRLDESMILDIVNKVARAAGISGMVGGQALDIESEGKEVDLATLQSIHTHKTGALILVSIQIGAILAGAKKQTLKAFTHYGEKVGLAFQIVDDILNVEGKAALLGKSTGGDLSKRKATYPSLFGIEESKRKAKELVTLAVDALSPFGTEVDPLKGIARFIVSRQH